jgi:predicted RNA-binding protein (virulence factor B family)
MDAMIVPGKTWSLTVLREAQPGLYLDGLNLGEILLPGSQIPSGTQPGDCLEVFVHHDSEDRLVATVKRPLAQLNQVAGFEVVGVRPGIGAFLNWGLDKDLLLPLREQTRTLRTGEWVVAIVLSDKVSGRLIASCRLHRHIHLSFPEYAEGQAVSLVIAEETDLGFKAVVENSHWGLLYHSEHSAELVPGDELTGYIRAVREDGKIDLRLDPAGYQRVGPLAQQILAALEAAGGTLPFNDKSSPEEVRDKFATSKKAFKQALGALLRKGRVHFVEGGVALGKG